ncbi:BrnT family toxin [Thalassospira alkalitolerans]|uniref:BrnT family toxin n=1 Tax=Thalassospira alkalitolerans TaxID=1293890 RepID=UPI0030EB44A1|tara:strand:- start:50400 stop:50672 length:273 start_codon:yes stop_codon:yes gene_type:complete
MIDFEWDDAKAIRNEERHGVPFAAIFDFDFDTALVFKDDRQDYGEDRRIAIGFITERLHVLIYTMRDTTMRIISLRKANQREIKTYVDQI